MKRHTSQLAAHPANKSLSGDYGQVKGPSGHFDGVLELPLPSLSTALPLAVLYAIRAASP